MLQAVIFRIENRQRCENDIFLLIPSFSTIHRTTRKMQRKDLVSLQREIKCFNHECPTWVETKFSSCDKIGHSFPTSFKYLLNRQRHSSIHFEHMSSSTFRYRRIIIYLYIITIVKHAIWLVNSRAGSGYPVRGIKMPSRDFQNVIVSL